MDLELFSMLISQTCQVTCLAIVVWVLNRLLAKNRPHLAHAMWMLVLLKCLTPPIWSSPTSPFCWMNKSNQSNQVVASLSDESVAQAERLIARPDIIVHTSAVRQSSDFQDPFESERPSRLMLETDKRLLGKQYFSDGLALSHGESRGCGWPTVLIWVWLVGAFVGLLACLIRYACFVVWLRKAPTINCPAVDASLTQLLRQLSVKRSVRVSVLDCPVGPAMMGLFRPTILLPKSVAQGKTALELEPLLAHELIHLRRGDVWWALIQTLATNLFWFHPLVWLANKMATRESERCCDEETVMSLGCAPATYARKLIEVLEQKENLRVAPTLPGVRPIDITSARLERVMKIGHGSHRRTPAWIWLVLFVGAVIALPGAAMIVAQEGKASEVESPQASEVSGRPVVNIVPDSRGFADSIQLKPMRRHGVVFPNDGIHEGANQTQKPQKTPIQAVPVPGKDRVFTNAAYQYFLKTYDVKEIVSIVRKAENLKMSPEKRLILELPCRYSIDGASSTSRGQKTQFAVEEQLVCLGGDSPTMKIVGDTLYVYDTQVVQNSVRKKIAQLQVDGFRQIVVQTHFVETERDDLKKLGVEWSIGHSAVGELSNPESNFTNPEKTTYIDANQIPSTFGDPTRTRSKVRAASFVEKSSPVFFSLLDDSEVQEVVDFAKGSESARVLQAPTVTMFNGQTAQVVDGLVRPFVTGLNRLKDADGKLTDSARPVIRMVTDGTKVSLQANAKADDSVDLSCHVNVSKVISVDTAEVPIKLADGKCKIQIPEVATSQIQSTMNIPAGKTLVLGSFIDGEKGEKQNLLVMLKCRTVVHVSEFPGHLDSPNRISQADAQKIIGHDVMPTISFMKSNGEFELDQASVIAAREHYNNEIKEMTQSSPKIEESELPESYSTPVEKIYLTSGEKAEGVQDLKPLVEAFAKSEMKLEVTGKVHFEERKDRIVVWGKELVIETESTIANGEPEFRASGNRGEIHVALDSDEEIFLLKFEGDVKLQMDELVMSAEKIKYGDDGREFVLELEGDAKAKSDVIGDAFRASAKSIKFEVDDNELLVLEGNAHLVFSDKKNTLHAERIEWNSSSGEVRTTGVGSVNVSR
jgi:beta-lactamase regulating signal transducer with metallopeptidase domain